MRKSADEARRTRDRIVGTAVLQASTEGLSGLTIGTLAESLGMSKAGVVGPFGSRSELQRATLLRAMDMFTEAVVTPSLAAPPGLPRLRSLIDSWCAYLADSPFPNGCFVTAASCELDGRPGELRTHLRDAVTRWRTFLHDQIATAQSAGDIPTTLTPDALVTTLTGIAMSANQEIQLLADPTAADRARTLMHALISAFSDKAEH
ncbi:TetR/AcrR family transcriptional regulator [Streptomyces griseosporeus]|uniref:TetR/AcrR family transcriptional regulator n=1 Tax=Streptomyces griseosporeus TaxID=1910 RepID=UPI00167D95CA|nr:TetR/AcrR family transcriptional regulator [Streptomyces griseosporeus]GHF64361.1 TetR family transcriptional regulator [Streptomyces griseosporeus]